MEEIARAKINLALHVRGREPNGYHQIETIFAFAEEGDLLRVEAGEGLTLAVEGPFAADLGPDNLVLNAAGRLRSRFGVAEGAALTLDKRLPVASGIGGGSADAAAALRLLVRWWKLDAEEEVLLELARVLGADVPACLRSEAAGGEGRGDQLSSQDGSGLSGMPLLLVNPGVPLSTAAVFAAWGGEDGGPLPITSPLATALAGRNDLEAPACALVPEIRDVLVSLSGAMLARMSGSGATCFGLFESEAQRDATAAAIAHAKPHWWQLATRLA